MVKEPWKSMNTKDIAITFEARKISMRQNKDGFVLVMGIHPNDLPRALITSWVGSIWQVGMVQVGDDGMPVVPQEKKERNEPVTRAGLLCRTDKFQQWLAARYDTPIFEDSSSSSKEEQASAILRNALGVESRAELKTDDDALALFNKIMSAFEETIHGRTKTQ